jgi:hypothetical protein
MWDEYSKSDSDWPILQGEYAITDNCLPSEEAGDFYLVFVAIRSKLVQEGESTCPYFQKYPDNN